MSFVPPSRRAGPGAQGAGVLSAGQVSELTRALGSSALSRRQQKNLLATASETGVIRAAAPALKRPPRLRVA